MRCRNIIRHHVGLIALGGGKGFQRAASLVGSGVDALGGFRLAIFLLKKIEILAAYEPCARFFAEWWKQLYGESEGKENKGLFPARMIRLGTPPSTWASRVPSMACSAMKSLLGKPGYEDMTASLRAKLGR